MSNFAPHEPSSGVIEVAEEVVAKSEPETKAAITERAKPRSMAGVVGNSPAMIELYEMVDRVAATTCTVLITGESGTGKELVARAIHQTSSRR